MFNDLETPRGGVSMICYKVLERQCLVQKSFNTKDFISYSVLNKIIYNKQIFNEFNSLIRIHLRPFYARIKLYCIVGYAVNLSYFSFIKYKRNKANLCKFRYFAYNNKIVFQKRLYWKPLILQLLILIIGTYLEHILIFLSV